ncbi:MAG: hypothetical protein JJU25_14235 [Halomonas sp.]|nr:hypothetical protein [Halomonas sp.]MCC5883776.1 hypothetical protein [Halomonas sp.]
MDVRKQHSAIAEKKATFLFVKPWHYRSGVISTLRLSLSIRFSILRYDRDVSSDIAFAALFQVLSGFGQRSGLFHPDGHQA